MKTMFVCFLVLCTVLMKVQSRISMGALMDNADICLKEFGLTLDQALNSKGDTSCFEFCMLKRLDAIEDNQINIQKFQEFISRIKSRKEAQLIVSATQECTELIPVLEDNCESFTEIRNCINEKLGKN